MRASVQSRNVNGESSHRQRADEIKIDNCSTCLSSMFFMSLSIDWRWSTCRNVTQYCWKSQRDWSRARHVYMKRLHTSLTPGPYFLNILCQNDWWSLVGGQWWSVGSQSWYMINVLSKRLLPMQSLLSAQRWTLQNICSTFSSKTLAATPSLPRAQTYIITHSVERFLYAAICSGDTWQRRHGNVWRMLELFLDFSSSMFDSSYIRRCWFRLNCPRRSHTRRYVTSAKVQCLGL